MTKLKYAAWGVCMCIFASLVLADTLELKNGSLIKGRYMGGSQSEIDFQVGSSLQHYSTADVISVKFEPVPAVQTAPTPVQPAPASNPSQPAAGTTSGAPALASRPAESAAPAAQSSTPRQFSSGSVTVPAGTRLVVRTIDAVDSDKNKIGDRFQASLEEPLLVDGSMVAPKGTTLYGRLEQAKAAGQLSGRSELRLSLTGIVLNGQTIALTTGDYSVSGASRTGSTATKVGGGAAVGALIGAIAGGGKGAAIGAGVGAGAGTAVQVMTKGEQVKVPSETLLEFAIDQPVSLPAVQAATR